MWGKVLTLDRLQKRGWQLPNRCFLCGCEEETVNHIILHCIVVRVLWEIALVLFGIQWVFPETVKEVLSSWRGPFVGKKKKKIWKSISLCIFWTVWKERNRLTFRGGYLTIQKLKILLFVICGVGLVCILERSPLSYRFFGVVSFHLRAGEVFLFHSLLLEV